MRVLTFVLAVSLAFVVGALTTAHCPWVKEVFKLDCSCKCCPVKDCCPNGCCPK